MKSLIKRYDNVAKLYDKLIRKYAKSKADIMVQKRLLKLINKKSKILDLGVGTGLSSKEFIKRGHEVIGIDISKGMLNEAKKYKFKKLIQQNLESPLKFDKDYFDVVVMVEVMEFVKNPKSLFKRVRNVLKNKGYFGLTVPRKLRKSVEHELNIKNYYTKDIEKIIIDSGFKIVSKKRSLVISKRENIRLTTYFMYYKSRLYTIKHLNKFYKILELNPISHNNSGNINYLISRI